MNMELPKRPDLSITIGEQKIKMTYGLEMDLRRMLPDPVTALQLIRDDPYTQDYIIRRVLTPAKKIITNPDDLVDMEEIDIDSDDVEQILIWATEHALYFFVKRSLGLLKLGDRYQAAVPVKPSSDGSETSASTTASAGPSDA